MVMPRMNVELGPSLARITAPLLAKDLRLPDYSGVIKVDKELTDGLNRSAELAERAEQSHGTCARTLTGTSAK